MEKSLGGLSEKFSGLIFFLRRSKKEFEMVADEIENKSLKSALNGLSDESNYYAAELKNYLKSVGIQQPIKEKNVDEQPEVYGNYLADETATEPGNELQYICTQIESSLTNAYNELIAEETMPFQNLKEIMLYQLSALKYGFLRVKTLNNARFAAY